MSQLVYYWILNRFTNTVVFPMRLMTLIRLCISHKDSLFDISIKNLNIWYLFLVFCFAFFFAICSIWIMKALIFQTFYPSYAHLNQKIFVSLSNYLGIKNIHCGRLYFREEDTLTQLHTYRKLYNDASILMSYN